MPSIFDPQQLRKLPLRQTLGYKFAVLLTIFVTSLMLINTAVVIYLRVDYLEEDLKSHARSFVQFTAPTIGTAYNSCKVDEVFRLRDIIDNLIRQTEEIRRVEIINKEGVVLFDSANRQYDHLFKSSQGSGQLIDSPNIEPIRALRSYQSEIRTPQGKYWEIIQPYINEQGQVPFVIRYLANYDSLRSEIRRLVISVMAVNFLAVLLSIGMATILARQITKSVQVLADGTAAIAQGNFKLKLHVPTNDELEYLAANFNFMAEQLRQNIQQLEESKAKLEESNLQLGRSNSRLAETNRRLENSQKQLKEVNQRLEDSNNKLAMANEQLEKANVELKELDRLKSEFLQTLSHELRTPLSAIKGYSDYLLEQMIGKITTGQERALRTIQRNTDRLAVHINSLLDLSRLETSNITLQFKAFPPINIINEVIAIQRPQLEKQQLEIRTVFDENLPAVWADPERLRQVMQHLLSNAIKFTPEKGKVTVFALAVAGGRRVQIRVEDTGIGIKAEDQERIFERFYQADSSTTRNYGGIGLGLTLVKSILASHNSQIHLESQLNVGSTFSFELESAPFVGNKQ
jgi:signal transduction histidine kinase